MPAPFHNRARNIWGWMIDELVLILLRQFKRVLDERGAALTDSQYKEIAARVAQRERSDVDAPVIAALQAAITESEQLLASLGLTFESALETEMTDLAGWDTTADFLTLANEKVNAELRISAGASLLALLGDVRFASYALISARRGIHDSDDVDAVIALRALAFAAGIDPKSPDRWAQIAAWLE